MTDIEQLQESLGVRFNDPSLIMLALTHSSYLNESPGSAAESNERLEFLGDAVLDLVIADELYHKYPDRPEGALTQMRVALVRSETLARVARSLDLGQRLLVGRGEEATGGRERDSSLEAAFEALVGAVYIDLGYREARNAVLRVMGDEISDVGGTGYSRSAKSELQELVQARGIPAPSYRIVDTVGADHARTFTAEVLVGGKVMGRGKGRRKAAAEQEAARAALDAMN